eukprot:768054-Hanusia_phi.AAC.4
MESTVFSCDAKQRIKIVEFELKMEAEWKKMEKELQEAEDENLFRCDNCILCKTKAMMQIALRFPVAMDWHARTVCMTWFVTQIARCKQPITEIHEVICWICCAHED